LNAWIGGFQSVLNKMKPSNFDWCMHALLFLHTERVVKAQQEKQQRDLNRQARRNQDVGEDDNEIDEEGFDVDNENENE
jgi:hypothetical protein